MAKFCECGSLIISDNCTNKNCTFKPNTKSALTKTNKVSRVRKKTDAQSTTSKTRRASKCVTYNLNDFREKKDVD